jgi:hypothetical protein
MGQGPDLPMAGAGGAEGQRPPTNRAFINLHVLISRDAELRALSFFC